jgi:hypothetical protein
MDEARLYAMFHLNPNRNKNIDNKINRVIFSKDILKSYNTFNEYTEKTLELALELNRFVKY